MTFYFCSIFHRFNRIKQFKITKKIATVENVICMRTKIIRMNPKCEFKQKLVKNGRKTYELFTIDARSVYKQKLLLSSINAMNNFIELPFCLSNFTFNKLICLQVSASTRIYVPPNRMINRKHFLINFIKVANVFFRKT